MISQVTTKRKMESLLRNFTRILIRALELESKRARTLKTSSLLDLPASKLARWVRRIVENWDYLKISIPQISVPHPCVRDTPIDIPFYRYWDYLALERQLASRETSDFICDAI